MSGDWPDVAKCDNLIGRDRDMPCGGALVFEEAQELPATCSQCGTERFHNDPVEFVNYRFGGPGEAGRVSPWGPMFPMTLLPSNERPVECERCGMDGLQEFGPHGWGIEYFDKDGSLCCSWLCEPWDKYGHERHVPPEGPTPEEVQGAIDSILSAARAHDA